MVRIIGKALAIGVGLLSMATLTQPALATAFTYDLTAANSTGTQSYTTAVGNQSLSVKITAWHATDKDTSTNTTDAISAASLATYKGAGLGVLYGNDNDNDGTHQIDNVGGGADFIMLQFNQDVTLSSISRNVYSITGATCCDSDAAYWADSSHALGAASSTATIQLSNYMVDESLWTTVAGGSSASTTALSPGKTASVWLVGAAFNQTNDAFKLAGFTANTAASVPEPSTWAMMLIGFGAIGCAARRKRATATFNVA